MIEARQIEFEWVSEREKDKQKQQGELKLWKMKSVNDLWLANWLRFYYWQQQTTHKKKGSMNFQSFCQKQKNLILSFKFFAKPQKLDAE